LTSDQGYAVKAEKLTESQFGGAIIAGEGCFQPENILETGLNYCVLSDCLGVGQLTNIYSISENMSGSDLFIKP